MTSKDKTKLSRTVDDAEDRMMNTIEDISTIKRTIASMALKITNLEEQELLRQIRKPNC